MDRGIDPASPLGFWYLVTLWVTTLQVRELRAAHTLAGGGDGANHARHR